MTQTTEAEWTAPEIELAKTLWTKGVSVSLMALRISDLGVATRTKNAVIGWVQRNAKRHNLPARVSPDAPRQKGGRFGLPESEPSPERKAGLGKAAIRKPRLLKGQTPKDGLPITELAPNGCRYALTAVAPHRFCGRDSTPGRAYCTEHLKGLYQPPTVPGNPHARETPKD